MKLERQLKNPAKRLIGMTILYIYLIKHPVGMAHIIQVNM